MPPTKSWWDIIKSWRQRLWASQHQTEIIQAKLDRLQIACYGLLNYCQHNTLNFQREKLDDYLRNIERIMEENQK